MRRQCAFFAAFEPGLPRSAACVDSDRCALSGGGSARHGIARRPSRYRGSRPVDLAGPCQRGPRVAGAARVRCTGRLPRGLAVRPRDTGHRRAAWSSASAHRPPHGRDRSVLRCCLEGKSRAPDRRPRRSLPGQERPDRQQEGDGAARRISRTWPRSRARELSPDGQRHHPPPLPASSRRSARAAWARCIAPPTPRSKREVAIKVLPAAFARIPTAWRASSARRKCWRR